MSKSWRYILGFLSLIAITIWLAVLYYPDPKLHLIACDVGQGDAILVVYGKTQILVDGGPDNRVLDCLSRHLPFWDKDIEAVLLTHPQRDHYGGLLEVFRRYNVQTFVATPIDSSSQSYRLLKKVVGGSSARVINPTTGMVIRLGMIYLDILHPPHQFSTEKGAGLTPQNSEQGVLGAFDIKGDLNDYSVVAILRLREFEALLTGDIGQKVSDLVAEQLEGDVNAKIEYIKIPHHGSKNGLTGRLLNAAKPEIAVISVGKRNSYGHPHREVLEMFRSYARLPDGQGLRVYRTDELGDVEIVTDGKRWWVVD